MRDSKTIKVRHSDLHIFEKSSKPGSLSYYISLVSNHIDHIESPQFTNGIQQFRLLVSSEYNSIRNTNGETDFLNALFNSCSLQEMKSNLLLYIIFAVELVNIDIWDKTSKAYKIASEIVLVRPITHPLFWKKYRIVLSWLNKTMKESFLNVLQQILGLLWEWIKKDDSEAIISSLLLMDLLFSDYAFALDNNMDSVTDLLFRGFCHQSTNVRYASCSTLKTILSTKSKFSPIHLCEKISIIFKEKKYSAYEGALESFGVLTGYYPSNKLFSISEYKLDMLSSPEFSNRKYAYIELYLTYSVSPELFSDELFCSIFRIFEQIFKKKGPNRGESLMGIARLLFAKMGRFHENELCILDSILSVIISSIDSDQASYATISLLTAFPSRFGEFISSILNVSFSSLLGEGLLLYMKLYPQHSSLIFKSVSGQAQHILLQKSSQPLQIVSIFRFLLKISIPHSFISEQLCLQYSFQLSHKDIQVRKSAIDFIINYQNQVKSIEITQKLLSNVITEYNNDLRVYLLSLIQPFHCDSLCLLSLQTLVYDSNPLIRNFSFKYLANFLHFNFVENLIREFLYDNMEKLYLKSFISKEDLQPFLYLCRNAQDSESSISARKIIAPFQKSLIDYLFGLKVHIPRSGIELISLLIGLYPIEFDIESASLLVINNLNIHLSNNRVFSTIKLLGSLIINSNFLYENGNNNEILKQLIILSKYKKSYEHQQIIMDAICQVGLISREAVLPSDQLYNYNKQNTAIFFIYQSENKSNDYVLNSSAASVAVMTILDILSDNSLSTLHKVAINSLLNILKSNRELGSFLEKTLVDKIAQMLQSGFFSEDLFSSMPTLMASIDLKEFSRIIPLIIDLIEDQWNSCDRSLLVRVSLWIYHRVSDVFLPHLKRIVRVFMTDLDIKNIDSIMSALISFGMTISPYIHIVYPPILEWIVHNSTETMTCINVLMRFKSILLNCGSHKYSIQIFSSLIQAVRTNLVLHEKSLDVISVVAVDMGSSFLLYVPLLAEYFDFTKSSKLLMIINSSETGSSLPEDIIEPSKPSNKPENSQKNPAAPTIALSIENVEITEPSVGFDEDLWMKWFIGLSNSLIQHSSSRAISACWEISQRYYPMRDTLFPIALALHYVLFPSEIMKTIFRSVLCSPSSPRHLKQQFLNSIEILEILELPMPITLLEIETSSSDLDRIAQALRSSESLFESGEISEAPKLITYYQSLGLNQAASGILHIIQPDASLFVKLGQWEKALESYQQLISDGNSTDEQLNRNIMKCYWYLSRFDEMEEYARKSNQTSFLLASSWGKFSIEKFIEYGNISKPNESIESKFIFVFYLFASKNYNECLKLIDEIKKVFIKNVFTGMNDIYGNSFYDIIHISSLIQVEEAIYAISKNDELVFHRLQRVWEYRFFQIPKDPFLLHERLFLQNMVFQGNALKKQWIRFYESVLDHKTFGFIPKGFYIPPIFHSYESILFSTKVLWEKGLYDEAICQLRPFASDYINAEVSYTFGNWLYSRGCIKESISYFVCLRQNMKYQNECLTILNTVYYSLYRTSGDSQYLEECLKTSLYGIRLSDSIFFAVRIISILYQEGSDQIFEIFHKEVQVLPKHVWIIVLPQIIARISKKDDNLSNIINDLIYQVGKEHPSPVLYSLLVPLKSGNLSRKEKALEFFNKFSFEFPFMVESTLSFSDELLRLADSWMEKWNNAITATFEIYFNKSKIVMNEFLSPLFEMLKQKPKSLHESAFLMEFEPQLLEAEKWINQFSEKPDSIIIDHLWQLLSRICKRLSKRLLKFEQFPLVDASPKLAQVEKMDLSVPGTYEFGKPIIKCVSVSNTLTILKTKQRPRRISLFGSDGIEYHFLLKAHEDTRLDERVMQLFQFVNRMNDLDSYKIVTYKVTPISGEVGLIGWVENCTTLYQLIRSHRVRYGIDTAIESKVSEAEYSTQIDKLPLDKRIIAFEKGLKSTKGDDLRKILLLHSPNSELWCMRRSQYSISLAVTSMIGYIIGLGDRHLDNIMMESNSAKLVHIDFGDCFEVSRKREKVPELVPFRLTRILVNALELGRIDGTYRKSAEDFLGNVKKNGDQIIALLEVFIHDPLIQWMSFGSDESPNTISKKGSQSAIMIIARIKEKLYGKDGQSDSISLKQQIEVLINEATDSRNLCQMYRGWFPWW